MESRPIFWGLATPQVIMFYVIGTAAMLIFAYGFIRHILKYARGKQLVTPVEFGARLMRGAKDIVSQHPVRRRDKKAGWAHTAIFYGYLGGFVITTLYFIELDILRWVGVSFMKGKFYLVVSLLVDIGHLGLTCGLIYMIVRRAFFHLAKLDYVRRYMKEDEARPAAKAWRIEDWAFLSILLIIELSGFTQEAAGQIVDQPSFGAWSPIGYLVAKAFTAAGMTIEQAMAIRRANWWMHGILALAFTAAIPWYKAKHILSAAGSLLVRDEKPLSRLPPEREGAEKAGVSAISDLTWKDMLHLDACTKCGRCHEACPARASGYPLSPRDFILDLRLHNDEAQGCDTPVIDLIGGVIKPETLWACRSCGACQEICPVGIEHPSLIVRMRRALVERGEMDPLLRNTIGAIGDTGNSFGANSRARPAWTKPLEFAVKDIRDEPAETLWFVGDYASFDPRNQKVSQTVARLLKAAKEDFALLHEGEKTAGNDVRRVGEEGLWEELAQHNIGAMTAAKPFQRIITTDPHSYNTIKNEYPDLGEVAPITHYSTVLAELLRSGKLKVKKPLNKRVTFHDPCHLGRLNGGYDAPREVLALIGCELVEMPRNRDNSFCCGAGGGRIWIPDTPGTEKPSENRVHEAAALGGIDIFVTCCPKDLVMFEDARKTGGHEKDFVVGDLAELVAEAIELKSINLKDLPPLADRIVQAVAERIADTVAARIDQVISARLATMPAPVALPSPPAPSAPVAEVPASPEVGAPSAPVAGVAAFEAPAAPEPVVAPAPEPQIAAPAAGSVELKANSWANLQPVQPAVFAGYEAPPKEGPRILVTVKHVAKLGDEIGFTGDNRDIRKEFMEFSLNEWDDAALEEALKAIEAIGSGEVVVVTVGDEDADVTLRKALAKGATRAVRVWDDSLAGADPITIARALAGVAKAENPDLIFTGVQSSDQAHGATGTAIARILGLPHAAVIVGLEWDGAAKLTLARELEGGTRQTFELAAPAVVAIQTGISTPRFATMKMIKQAREKPLAVVDAAGVVDGSGGYVVRRMYVPEQTKAQMLTGTPQELAKFIADLVREKKEVLTMAGILIIAEHVGGSVRDITREAVGAANQIKGGFGGPVVVAVLSSAPEALVGELSLDGVDEIAVVKTPGDHFDPLVYEEAAVQLGQTYQPGLILVGHTVGGMGYAAALAARLGAGFASDVLALQAEEGTLVATRGAYGNKVNLEVAFPNRGIVVLALRGATYPAPAAGGSPTVTAVELDLAAAGASLTHTGYVEAPPSDIDISKAEYILSVGRGIQDKDNLPRFAALADRMGFTFGASRPIIDAGWLPKAHQVGQSGKVASGCKVYIAVGISGAVQHLFGMKHVDTIIAINTDPEAPIFNVATYGVNMDLFELTSALETQFNG